MDDSSAPLDLDMKAYGLMNPEEQTAYYRQLTRIRELYKRGSEDEHASELLTRPG